MGNTKVCPIADILPERGIYTALTTKFGESKTPSVVKSLLKFKIRGEIMKTKSQWLIANSQ